MSIFKMQGPGMLYVPAEPGPNVSVEDFHDWYETYHGPLRVRIPGITNSFRYKATDGEKPGWLASYDLDDVALLNARPYARLADERSTREQAIIPKLETLDRRIYTLISSRGELQSPVDTVLIAVTMFVDRKNFDEFNRWYEVEHTGLLSKVPGWLRTRRFVLSEGKGPLPPLVECLALHDYALKNGLGGPEHDVARTTPWRSEVMKLVSGLKRREYAFYHAFSAPPESAQKSIGLNLAEGTIVCNDGFHLKYRIDGPQDPKSPVVVFINSILTTYDIWNKTVELLRPHLPNHRFILYNPRGYAPLPKYTRPVSFDLLADDVEYLLTRLSIPKATLIGVSMGGVTTLTFAIRHPELLDKYVACDCNTGWSEPFKKAWDERIEVARGPEGLAKLAGQTVNRWFIPSFAQSTHPEVGKTRKMIVEADLEGFAQSAHALCSFDISKQLGTIKSSGVTVVGEQDANGQMKVTMEAFTKDIPQSKLITIPDAGHLPMIEQPEKFVESLVGAGGILSK